MSYQQLTCYERYQISAYLKAGFNQIEIANLLNRHKSTISRELSRNHGLRGYRPKQAHQMAQDRQQDKAQPRIPQSVWHRVRQCIRFDLSPEQTSLWLKQFNLHVSHERIYQYLLKDKQQGGLLYRHLRCQKQRKKRYGRLSRQGQIRDRVSIDQRPDVVDQRSRLGDWEADTIIGAQHQQAIVSLTERRSGFCLIQKVTRKTASNVSKAMIKLLTPFKHKVHTITSDNGREFAAHQSVSTQLKTKFYFAKPYASWQRGSNENMNGLVRQYFPKQHDFTKITQKEIDDVMYRLNHRPRKRLGMKTPNQVFLKINPPVALAT